ncbi:MAG: hypothetical protein LC135_02790 [Phycisphaerae bacterium]|jgi:hypothetical protein|nr:hypothetical protein [Phycisphaerae bacterium]MCZ2398782.1 hypothetical protein [Phycisphaerae bacterium]NUQ49267.1 hypothetical protein [Phycisphaerae bacterium]
MRKFRRIRSRLGLMALAAALPHALGCSLFVPRTQPVTITASDPEATIYVDGIERGKGTVSLQLDRDRTYGVLAQRGDRSGAAHIGRKISGTGILDLVGGFFLLVPFLGLLGAGFWDLDPDKVVIAIPSGANGVEASGSKSD